MSKDWFCSQPGCGKLHSEHEAERIASFTGKYRFLSNFADSPITVEGEVYSTVEHAYQALKSTNLKEGQVSFEISVASSQGTRSYQEDRFGLKKLDAGTLLWVADGHGGDEVSEHIQEYIKTTWDIHNNYDIETHIKETFASLNAQTRHYHAGSTLSLAYIADKKVYAAVLGDSPILVYHDEGETSSLWTSPEHNARSNADELLAVQARGGFYNGGYISMYYSGPGIQMTRVLGDYPLDSIVNREPEISVHAFDTRRSWVLIGSDGLFDPSHFKQAEEVDAVKRAVNNGWDASALVTRALRVPTHDNATAVLVYIK